MQGLLCGRPAGDNCDRECRFRRVEINGGRGFQRERGQLQGLAQGADAAGQDLEWDWRGGLLKFRSGHGRREVFGWTAGMAFGDQGAKTVNHAGKGQQEGQDAGMFGSV